MTATLPPLTEKQYGDIVILAIDPGPMQSAWLTFDVVRSTINNAAVSDNEQIVGFLRNELSSVVRRIVIEKVEGFGMPVGVEVFDTVYWSGRFAEAAHPLPVSRIGRKAIKIHLCGTARAKDPNVRQALLDRFGGSNAKGTKAKPGPLYGFAGDLWSALAVAVTYAELHQDEAA